MACRVCAVPLTGFIDLDTGRVRYSHPLRTVVQPVGHDPDPAPIDEVDARYVCDFCGDERIVYALRTVPISTVTTTGGGRVVEEYGTDWSACFACAGYIDAADLDGLHSRLRQVGPRLDRIAAAGVRVMQQAVLQSLLPGRAVAAIGRWPATPLPAATLPKVRDRLAALIGGPLGLPLGLGADEVRGPVGTSVAAARLFWVDPQFTELAAYAAGVLPATPVTAADLPAPHGLLAWAQPVGARGDLVAASWTTGPDGVRIVGYRSVGTGLPPAQVQQLRERIGWLGPRTHTHLPAGDLVDAGSPAGVVVATWLLIAQRLAETAPVAVDKAVRKAYQRAGRPAPQVRLVRIRGAHATGSGTRRAAGDQDGPQREFRWWVRGYWRNQPYGPGRAQRRLIFLDPHLRGPEGKPIKASTTVRVLAVAASPRSQPTPPERPTAGR